MRRCAASWSAASGNSSLKAANWATSTLVSQETSRIQVYYMGLAKNGDTSQRSEAKQLGQRIAKAMPLYMSRGQIPSDRAAHYSGLLQKYEELP